MDRQWCLKLELHRAEKLEMVNLMGNMNPWLRVVCNPTEGNGNAVETAVAWVNCLAKCHES